VATKIPTGVTKIPDMGQLIAAPATPILEATMADHLKVRLRYMTTDPKHIRSLVLRSSYGIKPPYNEDLCILMPAARVFNDFETYLDTFENLKLCGVLHHGDILIDADILVEDELTLAYVVS
jgi:hypothetical protein